MTRLCVCVCVCVCARARARACVHVRSCGVCALVCLRIYFPGALIKVLTAISPQE